MVHYLVFDVGQDKVQTSQNFGNERKNQIIILPYKKQNDKIRANPDVMVIGVFGFLNPSRGGETPGMLNCRGREEGDRNKVTSTVCCEPDGSVYGGKYYPIPYVRSIKEPGSVIERNDQRTHCRAQRLASIHTENRVQVFDLSLYLQIRCVFEQHPGSDPVLFAFLRQGALGNAYFLGNFLLVECPLIVEQCF